MHRDLADARRCLIELRHSQFRIKAEVVQTREQFAKCLGLKQYDVVLAECPTPTLPGTAAIELLHQTGNQTPLIFITDQIRRETVAELISPENS